MGQENLKEQPGNVKLKFIKNGKQKIDKMACMIVALG